MIRSILAALFSFVLGNSALAQCITYNTLTNGSNADATQVMGNFNSIVGCVRDKLTAARTYYVRTDGNDACNGLTNAGGSSGACAFLTLQKAMDVAAALDLSIFSVTVNVGPGSYSGPLLLKSTVGGGTVSFIGNETTPSSVAVTSAGQTVLSLNALGAFVVAGFKLTSSTSQDAFVGSGNVTLRNNLYAGSNNFRVYAAGPGVATLAGTNNQVSGGGLGLFLVDSLGKMSMNSAAFTFTTNVTYTSATVTARFIGYLECAATTFNLGAFTVTGPRYLITVNGAIVGTGGAAGFFPGSVAGATATGGVYQ